MRIWIRLREGVAIIKPTLDTKVETTEVLELPYFNVAMTKKCFNEQL
jgi:hypothetical protein